MSAANVGAGAAAAPAPAPALRGTVSRAHPDGFSINLRCVDRSGFEHVECEDFDGQNWERHGAVLALLSQP